MVNPSIIFRITHFLCNLWNMFHLAERGSGLRLRLESQLCCILGLSLLSCKMGILGPLLSLYGCMHVKTLVQYLADCGKDDNKCWLLM